MTDRPAAGAVAFTRGAWAEAHRLLSAAPPDGLAAADLERLAVAAYLTGRDDAAVAAWERAHRRRLDHGEPADAAQCAFWAAFCLMLRGELAQAGGWLHRAETVIDGRECAAAGYLLIPALLGALDAGEAVAARDLAVRVGEVAERFGDADLAALAVLGHGQALVALGEEPAGMARFDDVMLSVRSGEVGPIVSGIVYCAVVLACMECFDLGRAGEWTRALDAWCEGQPDLVPYRGQCLVHQSQLQQAAGEWTKASTTVRSACERLADPPHPALGLACYQEAELLRLRGDLDAAADAYARASRAGQPPMPGLALLELARGDTNGARAGIRRALAEEVQPFRRPALLAAAVEIGLAAGQIDEAHEAADELREIAARSSSPALLAMAEHALGSVALVSGAPSDALRHLRSASDGWRRLRMPYEAARASVQLGRACLAYDDRTAADLELAAARETFSALGARADLAEVDALSARPHGASALSARELEVLAHVAEGRTNPEIAEELSISTHTVARHLENIFAKAGVSGRAAATAWAYEQGLL